MMMKYASVYRIKDELVFCSNAQTVDQLSLAAPPYLYLSVNADEEEMFSALNVVLAANKSGVPHPKQDEWAAVSKRHLQGLKLGSMSAMHRKASLCSIAKSVNELIFTPTVKEGVKGSFLHCVEKNVVVPIDSSSDVVAQALINALSMST